MIAANIMTTGMHTLTPGATISDALRLAAKTPLQIPVVVEDNKVFGVISLRRLLKAVFQELNQDTVYLPSFVKGIEGLRSQPVDKFIDRRYSRVLPHARLIEIAAMFTDGVGPESVLVVDDQERLLGMISQGDLFKRLWEYSEK